MFPINFNFPYRKKDGSIITMEKALDGAGADLDLIDLDDVAITTPAEGDVLVYDNTAKKWKNSDVVIDIEDTIDDIEDTMAENGAHNFLNHDITSQSLNDITVTVADDNSITVSGTASDSGYLVSSYIITGIKAGVNYKFGGFPSDLAEYSAYLEREDGGSSVSLGDFVGADTTYRLVIFFSGSFTTGGNPVTFKPMIRLTSDPSTKYATYAMTNRELTEQIKYKNALDAGIDISGYTENNKYRIPKEGYIRYRIPSEKTNVGVIVYGSNTSNTTRYINDYFPSTTMEIRSSIYVKEGMYAYCVGEVAEALFFGLS